MHGMPMLAAISSAAAAARRSRRIAVLQIDDFRSMARPRPFMGGWHTLAAAAEGYGHINNSDNKAVASHEQVPARAFGGRLVASGRPRLLPTLRSVYDRRCESWRLKSISRAIKNPASTATERAVASRPARK